MLEKIQFKTSMDQNLMDLREEVARVVTSSGVKDGVCYVYSPHSTAGIVVTPFFDDTQQDLLTELNRIIPIRTDFVHQWDPPADAAGHVKTAMFGVSQFFIIQEGQLVLGHAQGIMFFEFDGPREREVFVKIVAG